MHMELHVWLLEKVNDCPVSEFGNFMIFKLNAECHLQYLMCCVF